jgi:hypothetical protein
MRRCVVVWVECFALAYAGALILSFHSCDKAIDPNSVNLLLPLFLLEIDIIAALIYGTLLAIIALIAGGVAKRLGVSKPLTERVTLALPVVLSATAVIATLLATKPTGCHPWFVARSRDLWRKKLMLKM